MPPSTLFGRVAWTWLLSVSLIAGAACSRPGPLPATASPVSPIETSTQTVGAAPIPTNEPSVLATPTSSVLALPIQVPPTATVASPLDTPTRAASATATSTSSPVPTVAPAPSATPLIAVSTFTRVPVVATRVPVQPSPVIVLGPTATRAPTPTPPPTVLPILVTAWVSETNPLPGEDVTVYGRLLVNGQPVKGEGMVAHWHFKGRYVDCVGDTWVDGVAYCTENTYGLPAGFTVRIEVFIEYNQAPYRATTELTIRD